MSEPEWTPVEDWGTVKKGDRVQLRSAFGNVEGVLGGIATWPWVDRLVLDGLDTPFEREAGWSLFLQTPPAPEIPTEPGYYVGTDQLADCPILVIVEANGRICRPDASKPGGLGPKVGNPERFAPFTHLERRTDTAKTVLNRIRAVDAADIGDGGGCCSAISRITATVAAEFGVADA